MAGRAERERERGGEIERGRERERGTGRERVGERWRERYREGEREGKREREMLDLHDLLWLSIKAGFFG